MLRMVGLEPRGWSLARQLVILQLCVVVTAVGIEAMVAIYRGPQTTVPLRQTIATLEQRQILGLVALTEVALLVGIAGSLFVADRVRKQTFDMEPAEIARRYQHHDAMLHAVREGLIITDVSGNIVLANDEARRLLELAEDNADKPLSAQVTGADWADTEEPVTDRFHLTAGRVLMISRSRAEIDGTLAGMVTTLRDRTELQQALHELSEVSKQAHEHANHLQMIIALIEMGEHEEAIQLAAKYAAMPQQLSAQAIEQSADPVLLSRLQLLHARAEGLGVDFGLDSTLESVQRDLSHDLTDIVGNLVDNAIDAAAAVLERAGQVRLSMTSDGDGILHITVRDNGDGITAQPPDLVFTPRWSTKGDGRGFGLSLVRDKVRHLRGTISAHNDGGAVFDVRIPVPGTPNGSER